MSNSEDSNVFKVNKMSISNQSGTMLETSDKIIRAISSFSAFHCNELLACGLLNELMEKGLFPKTKVSEIELVGYSLVVEHEKITPVIYPFEWSPEMLRSAALCTLEVNFIANSYGYELIDSHPYNVVFKYNKPMFVDFGSIVKKQSPAGSWVAYNQFLSCFFYPLQLCSKGFTEIYKHQFLLKGGGIDVAEMASILNPIYRILGINITRKIFSILNSINFIDSKKINSKFENPLVRITVKAVVKTAKFLTSNKINLTKITHKIKTLNIRSKSMWATYHETSGYYCKNGALNLPPRMLWVTKMVTKLTPASILEFAGNQGVLSRSLAEINGVNSVICTDYDQNSIDTLILSLDDSEKVSVACFNFISEEWQLISGERAERLRSEVVIALAVTHHLILSQGISMEHISRTLKSYSSKYVIVEFMPLGLWDGVSAPTTPDWYNEVWFIKHLENNFDIIERSELEPNRVIFVGKVKNRQ